MAWPIQKDVTVGSDTVATTSEKIVLADGTVVIKVTATSGGVVFHCGLCGRESSDERYLDKENQCL